MAMRTVAERRAAARPGSPGLGVRALALCAVLFASGAAEAFVWPNVPDQIARALSSGDVAERRLAAQRLVELPPEIATVLAQRAMNDPDVEVRLRVAQAAVALRMPRGGDAVVSWLSDNDARLRLAACDVIHVSPTNRSIVALGRVLGDPDAHVRLAAAGAMGSSGLPDAVSPLLGHLDDASPEVRAEVARALGRIGDGRAAVPLIGKVQDTVSEVRRAVARALGDLGDRRAVSALMLTLQDASAEVRLEAVAALGKLGSDEATAAIAALVEAEGPAQEALFGSRLPRPGGIGAAEVRAAALRALGAIGSEAAVKVLVSALAKDDPAATRSHVRDALVVAGARAEPALVSLLSSSPSSNAAAGAALSLGKLRAQGAAGAVVRAMQRGVLPVRAGLQALSQMRARDALPAVLELFDHDDPMVRKEAIASAAALLDPAHPDGRAVDPAVAALNDPGTPGDEKVELVRLLGRTGAPRAEQTLLSLLSSKVTALRLAVIEALGSLRQGSAATDAALARLLDDESHDVRFRAAVALSRIGTAAAAPVLLERLTVAAEQDRGALGVALSGVATRVSDPSFAARLGASVGPAPDVAREALIEALGRMRGEAASRVLSAVAAGGVDDRRKVAEALAGHAEAQSALRSLARDADPGVRANAAWSLGAAGDKDAGAALRGLLRDPDIAVAGNAAGALGLLAARLGEASLAQAALCEVLSDTRAYVRANAIEALSLSRGKCAPSAVRGLLARDPAEAVRLSAADYLARAVAAGGDGRSLDRRALVRCAGEDRNAAVASRCQELPAQAGGTDDVTVFVVPTGRDAPMPRAPYALVRPDGLLRMGLADRRGAVFERSAPRGVLRLAVPAPLAR